jgi:hypothetical protein
MTTASVLQQRLIACTKLQRNKCLKTLFQEKMSITNHNVVLEPVVVVITCFAAVFAKNQGL